MKWLQDDLYALAGVLLWPILAVLGLAYEIVMYALSCGPAAALLYFALIGRKRMAEEDAHREAAHGQPSGALKQGGAAHFLGWVCGAALWVACMHGALWWAHDVVEDRAEVGWGWADFIDQHSPDTE